MCGVQSAVHACSAALQAGAVAAVLHCQMATAAVLYTLALNHKQMLLYYAPAFFATMLGWCFHPQLFQSEALELNGRQRGCSWLWRGCLRAGMLGGVVAGTCAAVWAPFLLHEGVAAQVLAHLHLLARDVYSQ